MDTRRIDVAKYGAQQVGACVAALLRYGCLTRMGGLWRGGQRLMWADSPDGVIRKRDRGKRWRKETLDRLEECGVQVGCKTFAFLLRKCGDAQALAEGKRLHAHVVRSGFGRNRFLGNLIVEMYAKCGALEDARDVFEKMYQRNVFSWTIMITAYAQRGHGESALRLFQRMEMARVVPDRVTFVGVLSACTCQADLVEGKRIHERILSSGIELDVVLGTVLVNMYAKCGSVENAWKTFESMPERNVVSWNAMIEACSQHGNGNEVLQLFERMQLEDVIPDKVTFISVLSSFAIQTAIGDGKWVHAYIMACGLESDVAVGTALVSMYAKCGSLEDARRMFDRMPERDVVSWNAMVAVYAQHGHGKEALQLFQQMQLEGFIPNKVTFVSILSACAGEVTLTEGKLMHARIVASGFESDVTVGNALISLYGKCNSLEDAWKSFYKMPEQNSVSWNAMIAACAQHGHGADALRLFQQMRLQGVIADKITFVSILATCSSPAALDEGKRIHSCIVGSEFWLDVVVGNSLLNMYSNCGSMGDAQEVFDKMPDRDLVSWNSMIAAYVQNSHDKEALLLYQQMQKEGIASNRVTFISILSACANLAALAEGKRIHDRIVASGFKFDVVVGNALVNMYGKCGSLEDALSSFDKMPQRNVVSWNTMMAAFGQHGHCHDALQLFQLMLSEGVIPNKVSFVNILFACSHAGLVDEGCHYFISMSQDHGIVPTMEHYNCMIDLFGRSGHLAEGQDMINKMPCEPTATAWMTLLGACRMHCDVEQGKYAAEHVFELDPDNAAPYVLLSNIYATAGRWHDVSILRNVMKDRGLKKQPGCSSIEIDNRVHEFLQEMSYT